MLVHDKKLKGKAVTYHTVYQAFGEGERGLCNMLKVPYSSYKPYFGLLVIF